MDILIGTKNNYKVDELRFYLEDMKFIKVHLLRDQDIEVDILEDGNTLEENAQKKAIEISKKTKFLVLASDGGVDIPALNQDWNFLKNERTIGKEKSDVQKAEKLLKLMKGLDNEERRVEFHHALALAKKGKLLWSNEKVVERGYIAKKLPDKNIPEDKWLSHIWYYPEFGKVFNKLDEYELGKVREQSRELKKSLQKKIKEILDKYPVF